MNFIDGEKLYHAFLSGKVEVLKQRNHLNEINVFPVPDGDTGTNLAYTMNSIVEGSSASSSVAAVSAQMADAAILGSRGNSGIIFAQFMQGLHDSAKDKSVLYAKDFVDAIRRGVDYAYKSISQPVEGTILTVMKSWSESLHAFHGKAANFTDLISHSIDEAKIALQNTPKRLKVLQDAGVVDAGGLGFVHFIEGFLSFIKTGVKHSVTKSGSIGLSKTKSHKFKKYQKLEYRYCTEGVIKNPSINSDDLRKIVSRYGNSDITAGSKEYFKFHIHTNEPQDLFYLLKQHGIIEQSKVDDMQKQYEMQFHRKADIAIVVDSACDLPDELNDKYQISVVPINMTIGDHHFLDKFTIKPNQFYDVLAEDKAVPKTSQPSSKAFENLYEYIFNYYDAIISIHISGKLSGTFNAAKRAAEKFTDKDIAVIDSKHLSTSLGLIVLNIAEAVENRMSFKDTVEYAHQLSERAKILVGVPSLKYMIRSGRVSPVKGIIANVCNLKPIVSLDENGASALGGKSLSFNASIKKIINVVVTQNEIKPVLNYAIGHSNLPQKAKVIEKEINNAIGRNAAFIYDIAPVIGLHAGPGAVSVSYIG